MREKTRMPKPTIRVINCRRARAGKERGVLRTLGSCGDCSGRGGRAGSKHQVLSNHRQHLPSLGTQSPRLGRGVKYLCPCFCIFYINFKHPEGRAMTLVLWWPIT